jgi:hypothetical protein
MSAKTLTSAELEVIRLLFVRGLTWMATFPPRRVAPHFVIAASRNMNLVLCG